MNGDIIRRFNVMRSQGGYTDKGCCTGKRIARKQKKVFSPDGRYYLKFVFEKVWIFLL